MIYLELIDNLISAVKFNDTIFFKDNSDLARRYEALQKLNAKYPDNDDLLSELYIIKKGLDGENEIAYQLKKAHIGMYVLRDVKVKFEDLTAQIDYVVITPVYTYYIECKNLVGNITITEKGDFIRELTINGKKVKKGMYSPLRQVEAQREVLRKIWEKKTSLIGKILNSKNFEYYRKVLVVVANPETILNTSRAPKNMKYKILRADALVKQIEYDLNHRKKDEYLYSKKNMEKEAQMYLDLSLKEEVNYYDFYEQKYCQSVKNSLTDNLKERLTELRKSRSMDMKIPAYYIFTNDELDKIVELRPKTIEELSAANILTPIKVKTHGSVIIAEINK